MAATENFTTHSFVTPYKYKGYGLDNTTQDKHSLSLKRLCNVSDSKASN